MKVKMLLIAALLVGTFTANAQEEQKTKKTIGFDVTNVSLGISPGLTGSVDPNDFTIQEFLDHQGTMIDLGMSANIYGEWNLRLQVGYLAGTLNPSDYFEEVQPWEWGVYDFPNNEYYIREENNGITPGSNVFLNFGGSRDFHFDGFTITPIVGAWATNERPRIAAEGYEIIATGEYVNERIYWYEDWGVNFYPSFGLDFGIDKYLIGLTYNSMEVPVSNFTVRLGYQF